MYTFSTRALILVHHGTVKQNSQPILNYFKNETPQYKIYSLNCILVYFYIKCIYSCVLKYVIIFCLMFFCISLKTPFSIFTFQKRSWISRESKKSSGQFTEQVKS